MKHISFLISSSLLFSGCGTEQPTSQPKSNISVSKTEPHKKRFNSYLNFWKKTPTGNILVYCAANETESQGYKIVMSSERFDTLRQSDELCPVRFEKLSKTECRDGFGDIELGVGNVLDFGFGFEVDVPEDTRQEFDKFLQDSCKANPKLERCAYLIPPKGRCKQVEKKEDRDVGLPWSTCEGGTYSCTYKAEITAHQIGKRTKELPSSEEILD